MKSFSVTDCKRLAFTCFLGLISGGCREPSVVKDSEVECRLKRKGNCDCLVMSVWAKEEAG